MCLDTLENIVVLGFQTPNIVECQMIDRETMQFLLVIASTPYDFSLRDVLTRKLNDRLRGRHGWLGKRSMLVSDRNGKPTLHCNYVKRVQVECQPYTAVVRATNGKHIHMHLR